MVAVANFIDIPAIPQTENEKHKSKELPYLKAGHEAITKWAWALALCLAVCLKEFVP